MAEAESPTSDGSTGGDLRDDVGGLIGGIAAEVLSRAEVSQAVRGGAQFYKRIAVVNSGISLGFCIATQNYAGAVFVVASHAVGEKVSSAAANIILEKGGFAARLQLDPEQKNSHVRLLVGTFEPHYSVSILRIYNESIYWGADRAHKMGELALTAVDLGQASSSSAITISRGVDGRPYQRLGWFQRDALYRGTWEKEQREGWGTLIYPGFGTYSGSWSAGSPKGFGEIRYDNGGSYTGSISPGSGDRVLGVSLAKDGVIYAGEHRFPLHVFPDGTEVQNTRILPDGYGVRIVDGRALRATWRAGEIETELKSEAEHQAETLESIVERDGAATGFGVRAAEWRLKQATLDSAWHALERRLVGSGTVFLYDKSL